MSDQLQLRAMQFLKQQSSSGICDYEDTGNYADWAITDYLDQDYALMAAFARTEAARALRDAAEEIDAMAINWSGTSASWYMKAVNMVRDRANRLEKEGQ
jgi:hypothetical protein